MSLTFSRRRSGSVGWCSSPAKVTIFVTDMGRFEEVAELRRAFFTPPYPADSIVKVKALYDPAAMIEIEAIGVAGPFGG